MRKATICLAIFLLNITPAIAIDVIEVDKKNDLLGLILTHAHEDHIGAISHIWPDLNCDIYATPFTSVLIQEKFKEKKIDITPFLKIVELNSTLTLQPFTIEFITLTHSILEPNGLKIETPVGNILHTGDWKCDPDPLIGEKVNSKRLKQIMKYFIHQAKV